MRFPRSTYLYCPLIFYYSLLFRCSTALLLLYSYVIRRTAALYITILYVTVPYRVIKSQRSNAGMEPL